jgi:hypothetical protein
MAGNDEHKVYDQLSAKLAPMGMQASLRSLLSIDSASGKASGRLFNQYEFAEDIRRRLGDSVSILQASAAQIKPFTDKAHQREQKYLAFQSALLSRVLDNMDEDGSWKTGTNPFPLCGVSDVIPALEEDNDAYGDDNVTSGEVYFGGSVAEMAEAFRTNLEGKERGTDCITVKEGEAEVTKTINWWRSESGLKVSPMKTWCAMSLLKHQLMRTMPLVLLERKDGTSVEGKIYADYLDSNISGLRKANGEPTQLATIMRQVFKAAGIEKSEIEELLGVGAEDESEQLEAAKRRHNTLDSLFDNALMAIAEDWNDRDTATNALPREEFSNQVRAALDKLKPFANTPVHAKVREVLEKTLGETDKLSIAQESRPRLVEASSEKQSQAFIAQSHFNLLGHEGAWNLEVPEKVLSQYDTHPLSELGVIEGPHCEKQGPEKPLVFIMDPDGNVKLCRHKDTHYHHSTPDGGRPSMTAGEMKGYFHGSDNDKVYFRVTEVKNKSGHFWPSVDSLEQLKDTLVRSGMDAASVKWVAEGSPQVIKSIVSRWQENGGAGRIPEKHSLAKADKDNLKEAESNLARAVLEATPPGVRLPSSKSESQLNAVLTIQATS